MMTKSEQFLNYFDWLVANCKEPVTIPDEVAEVYNMLKAQSLEVENKIPFTETGMQILEYCQEQNAKNLKAKDIAEGLEMSSRKVSGAIRKLVSDGYIEKFGQNPVIYNLTEKGRTVNINEYKEKMNEDG